MTTLSSNKLDQLKQRFESMAGETGKIEQINGVVYFRASELACLRLFHQHHKFDRNGNARTLYSENLGSWVFVLE